MDITKLQSEAQEIFINLDSYEAIKLLGVLKKETSLSPDEDFLFTQLQFVRIASLNTDQLVQLLKDDLLVAYTIPGYDLADRVESYINQIDRPTDQIEVSRKVKLCLESNKSIFTKDNIVVKNQSIEGSIKNWLSDYNSYPVKEGVTKGALDEIEFVNKSSNVKKLTDVQLGVIKNILNLYDYLALTIAQWDSIPTPQNETEAFKGYDLYQFIPGLEEDLKGEGKTAPSEKVTKRAILSDPIKISDFDSVRSTPHANIVPPKANPNPPLEPVQESAPAPVPRTAPPKNPVHLAAPTNYDEIVSQLPKIKRGVVMDPTNIKITEEKQRMEMEKNSQAKHIQQKLAELRKRNNEK